MQQRFEQNRIAHGRPAKEDVSYLLTTKLFCGKCGTLMGGESGTSHMGTPTITTSAAKPNATARRNCDLKPSAKSR